MAQDWQILIFADDVVVTDKDVERLHEVTIAVETKASNVGLRNNSDKCRVMATGDWKDRSDIHASGATMKTIENFYFRELQIKQREFWQSSPGTSWQSSSHFFSKLPTYGRARKSVYRRNQGYTKHQSSKCCCSVQNCLQSQSPKWRNLNQHTTYGSENPGHFLDKVMNDKLYFPSWKTDADDWGNFDIFHAWNVTGPSDKLIIGNPMDARVKTGGVSSRRTSRK